jgi:hypothetical protein
MMPSGHKRVVDPGQRAALLKAIGDCRRACIAHNGSAPIGDEVYKRVDALMDQIDLLAETLTGSREHFHSKPIRQGPP